ncbi:MAG: YidC/Oxa1 family membrane protein insertase [Oscillospiraceae bacterium]|nr:YidC/Oxa1 family membrane protein insertase [Oscillospiraceae bacterium]
MDVLIAPLKWVMAWCYELCGNYGYAIIVFTVISKIILIPVSVWTHFNSIKMIRMQPDINFIKAKFYGQSDMIADEQSVLFKKNKYHPLATTIPTIIQLLLLAGVIEVIKAGIADSSIDMGFLFTNLGLVPSEEGFGLIWSPIVAGLSSFLLCVTQNASNVLQAEQSKLNKYGTMAFSVALSLYLGWFVSIGVAFYWVCSNILAIIQMYILNFIIKPSKYIDYNRLEESRKALSEVQNVGKDKKEGFFSANKKREREDYKRFFSVVNKHLVFYSESNGFYKYFKGFIEYILKNTNITIHYITSDPNDSIFEKAAENQHIRAYYIGENKLITLMMKMDADVVVMTMPDLGNFHIKRSYVRNDVEYIFVQHGMGSNNLTFRKCATDHFDTIFCAGIHQKEEEVEFAAARDLPERTLAEIGYPLIDDMRKKYESLPHTVNEKKKILIAPSWQKDNIIDGCLEQLLDELKKTDYEIIVRPHPQEVRLKKEYMEAIRMKYASSGIEVQTDFTSNNPVLEADLLITDWSDISWEYSFSTLRPVLFINTPMKVMNPDYKEISVVPINILLRNEIGRNLDVNDLDKVNTVVGELLAKQDEYREKIDALAHKYLYNLDHSSAAGAKYIINAIQEKVSMKGKTNHEKNS